MHNFVYHNDRILTVAEARLSPGQAGLFNGMGLFTTMRIYRGRPFAFERHWNRLRGDAAVIGFPFAFAADGVLAALAECVRANSVLDGCARIYFIDNKFGMWHSDEPMPAADLLICTSDLPTYTGATRLTVEPRGRWASQQLAGTKVTSWLFNVWTVAQAQRHGFDEAVLLNERGEVAECTAANVFSVRGGEVTTPPLSSGCLNGVTREVLLEIGRAGNPSVREAVLTLDDLHAADEVFITSTTREVLPVGRIADRAVPLAPGPITARLAAAFAEYVAWDIDTSGAVD